MVEREVGTMFTFGEEAVTPRGGFWVAVLFEF